jgi:hypothetical protein
VDNSQCDNFQQSETTVIRPAISKKQREEREIGVVTLFFVVAAVIILVFAL